MGTQVLNLKCKLCMDPEDSGIFERVISKPNEINDRNALSEIIVKCVLWGCSKIPINGRPCMFNVTYQRRKLI